MLSIEIDDCEPRVSLERRRSSCSLPFSPLLMFDGLSSKSIISYTKLPQEPIKLTVLKLDGSSFDIEVTKSARVSELKQAVEDVFIYLQQNPVKISWSHVWGHFCLCYDGEKLVIEDESIRNYGIKDGDQLHFVRHRSANHNLTKKRSKKQVSLRRQSMSSSSLDSYESNENNANEDNEDNNCDIEQQQDKDEDLMGYNEPKCASFLRGWFSYSRLATDNDRSDRITGGFCNGIRNILQLYSDKPYHRRETLRDD